MSPPDDHRRRGVRHLAVAAFGATVLAACGADPVDFQRSAEQFIEGDTMTRQANVAFTDARCERPPGTDRGTTFPCTATTDRGTTWRFEVTIVDDSNFEITGREAPGG